MITINPQAADVITIQISDADQITLNTTAIVIVNEADTLNGQNGAYYLSRANHTGTQAISTVTGLQAALDAKLETTAAGGVVRGTALTGLSTATAAPVTATDTVLVAAGKLQAQIAAKLNTTDAPATVRDTPLTGLSTATATAITAGDTVLLAAGKLQGQASANATAIADKLNTADAPATVRGTPLAGLSTASATPVTATDTVLAAAGKLQAQIAAKLNTADAPAAVRDTALTGLSTATATAITATDSVLSAAGKLQAQINAGSGSAIANTDALPEGSSNLYLTTQRVRDTALTGLSIASATPITAADTVLAAAGKLQRQTTDNAAILPPFFETAWYKSGLYYDAVYPYYTTIASITHNINVLYLCKRKILDDVTFNELSVNVATAAVGSTVFYGVYASDANGLPTTLLVSGSASSETTGVKSTAVTLALTKGQVVWDAYLNTGKEVSITAFQPIFQDGAGSPTVNGIVMLVRGNQTSLPADASGLAFNRMTTQRIPRVVLRVA